MTYQPVPCRSRADNFGITCVRAHPNDHDKWCRDCRERCGIASAPLPLSDSAVTGIVKRKLRDGFVSLDDGSRLLAEVLRLRT